MRHPTTIHDAIVPVCFVAWLLLCTFSLEQAHASWTSGGPYGGCITCMAMSYSDPDILYLGTEYGFYQTGDGGDTWKRTAFSGSAVKAVQVDPNNAEGVYVGTADGVYKSNDSGNAWNLVGLSGKHVVAMAIDPSDPQIIFAGTSGEEALIYKSSDGGVTWQEKFRFASDHFATTRALLIDTNDADYIFACMDLPIAGGLYRSVDGGETWGETGRLSSPLAIAMTPAGYTPHTLYVADGSGSDINISQNYGENWERTNINDGSMVHVINPNPPCALAVNPLAPEEVYVGTSNNRLYKSVDSGRTWQKKVTGLIAGSWLASIVIHHRNENLYTGLHAGGGIYISVDGAENWVSSNNGLNANVIEDIAVHPLEAQKVYASVRNRGYLSRSTDGGQTWDHLESAPTVCGALAFDPVDPSTLWLGDGYHSDYRFFIHKTEDEGQSWQSLLFFYYLGMSYKSTGVSGILINTADSRSLLVGMGRLGDADGVLALTTDSGQTWNRVGSQSTALAADPSNPRVVYSGKSDRGQIIRSQSAGAIGSWSEISPTSFQMGGVTDIRIGDDSAVYVATEEGLLKRLNQTWSERNNFPSDAVTALTVDYMATPEKLYAGTRRDGIFVSEDQGETWKHIEPNLNTYAITKLTISQTDPKILYAGTDGGGVWQISVDRDDSEAPGDGDGDGGNEDGSQDSGQGNSGEGSGSGGCFAMMLH